MGGETPVLIETGGAIATITLNRAERRNGVTVAMCHALLEAVEEVAASEARVVILRGAGQDFCVGADLGGGGEQEDRSPEALMPVYHAATLLHEMPQVTIAAIDGGCAGAGMGWACACDLRFASHEARFSTAFLNVGAPGDMGLGWTLPRIVGGARAREMLLFPDKFDAARALETGLVTRLFDREVLHRETRALAGQLAGRAPDALRAMKANLLSGETLGLRDYIEVESRRHLDITGQPDFAERFGKR
jgi:2-(1,2-epoxy-1,2-dihydrophenyl)acetyl-CoA isomerase